MIVYRVSNARFLQLRIASFRIDIIISHSKDTQRVSISCMQFPMLCMKFAVVRNAIRLVHAVSSFDEPLIQD